MAVSMARKNLRAQDVHEILGALLAEPQEQLAAGGMLVDEPRQRFLEQVELAVVVQDARDFLGQLGRDGIQRGAQHFVPPFGIGLLVGFQRAMVLGGGNAFEQRTEFDAVLQPDLRGRNLAVRRGHARGFPQFVAGEYCFQGHPGLRALVGHDIGVQRGDHFGGRRRLVLEVGQHLEHFRHHQHPGLEPLGRAEILEQPVLKGRFLRLVDDLLGLFAGHNEMAVLLHFPPGHFPPFLPVVADHVRHQALLDLVRRGLAAKTVQHDLDQFNVVRRQVADAFRVRCLAGEDVVLGNWPERFGGKGEVHRMAGLAVKVDGELRKNRVHCLDSSEAPAPMDAAAGLGQLRQCRDVPAFDLSGRRQFLEFFFHKFFDSLPPNGIR
jgi:hypothetical protein